MKILVVLVMGLLVYTSTFAQGQVPQASQKNGAQAKAQAPGHVQVGARDGATWQSRLAALELRMDQVLDREANVQLDGKGLLASVRGIEMLLAIEPSEKGITDRLAAIESRLGLKDNPDGGLIARVATSKEAALKRVAAGRADRSKLNPQDRLKNLEAFLGARFKEDDTAKLPREERLANLKALLPTIKVAAGEKPLRTLETYERALGLSPEADESFDARLSKVEGAAKQKTTTLDQYLTRAAIRMKAIEGENAAP